LVHVAKLDTQVIDAQRQAAYAFKEAGEANERASINELEAAGLSKEAEGLKETAEDERLARIKLAESISWRTPDRALIPSLAKPLQLFAGQRCAFVSDVSDPERANVISWIGILIGRANWKLEPSGAPSRSELSFEGTNIVVWVRPAAPDRVLKAAHALVSAMEGAKLSAALLQSGGRPDPGRPTEVIDIVVFKRGPRMIVTGNLVTFEGSPLRIFFGTGPPN
jgi:hypothetical protein